MVQRFPGSLIESSTNTSSFFWIFGRRFALILTRSTHESFVFRLVIRDNSVSVTIWTGNENSLESESFSVKNHSMISNSESRNSIILFRHSTRKTPSSWRIDLSWSERMYASWIFEIIDRRVLYGNNPSTSTRVIFD